MPRLIHITPRDAVAAIKRSGLRPSKSHGVVYFMPLAAGHYMAHQWARELKRRGSRTLSAIHFQLPSSTPVWHGHYLNPHSESQLGQAIKAFLELDDQTGYEFFVAQSINRNCIDKVVSIRRPMGWRYYPEAHGNKPC